MLAEAPWAEVMSNLTCAGHTHAMVATHGCMGREPPDHPEAFYRLSRAALLQLLEDVREECAKFGTLEGMCAPRPPISISDSEGSRVFVKFSTHEEAKAVRNAFNGREFDGRPVTASLASEDDYNKAMQGEWTGQYAQQPMSVAIDAGGSQRALLLSSAVLSSPTVTYGEPVWILVAGGRRIIGVQYRGPGLTC